MNRSRIFTRAAAAAVVFSNAGTVAAQDASARATIESIERRIEARAQEITQLRSELEELKKRIAADSVAAEPEAAPSDAPIGGGIWPSANTAGGSRTSCALVTPEQLRAAVDTDPWRLAECDRQQIARVASAADSSDKPHLLERLALGARLLDALGSYVPGRPLQTGGIRPTIELGKASDATLSISVPIAQRATDDRICLDVGKPEPDCRPGFRPSLLTPQLSISTPIDKDRGGVLFTGTSDDDPDTDGSDFADGLTLKAGFDWLNFRGVHMDVATDALDSYLEKTAMPACLKDAREKEIAPVLCSRGRIVDWVLQLKPDSTTPSGFVHAREEMAGKIINLMWRPAEKAVPTLGIGGSISYFSKDFKYSQARTRDELVNGKVVVVPDFSAGLAAPFTQATDNLELELHGLIYLDFDDHRKRESTPAGSVPGIMFVPQYTYRSRYAFAAKTALQSCLAQALPGLARCETINIDRPRRERSDIASLEARFQFLNLPVLDRVGMAPKFSYDFADDGIVLDLPIFFTTKGEFSSGVRATYSQGTKDLLGNEQDSKWEISIFFSPLKFQSFR